MGTTPTAARSIPKRSRGRNRPESEPYSPAQLAQIAIARDRLRELLRVSEWKLPGGCRPDAARAFLLAHTATIQSAYRGLVSERPS